MKVINSWDTKAPLKVDLDAAYDSVNGTIIVSLQWPCTQARDS